MRLPLLQAPVASTRVHTHFCPSRLEIRDSHDRLFSLGNWLKWPAEVRKTLTQYYRIVTKDTAQEQQNRRCAGLGVRALGRASVPALRAPPSQHLCVFTSLEAL